jgi:hypothetical protein
MTRTSTLTVSVPLDPLNTHYMAIQAWVAAGNAIAPPPPPPEP